MPPSAWWLGVLGLIPFVGCTVVSIVCAYNVSVIAREALLFYGAVILSFLGGIQWGFSVKGEDVALTVKPSMGRLCLTTVPALIGWLSLMLPPGVSSIVLNTYVYLFLASVFTLPYIFYILLYSKTSNVVTTISGIIKSFIFNLKKPSIYSAMDNSMDVIE